MMSMVELSHAFLKPVLHARAVCVDATLGQGKDSLFFLEQQPGQIHAFEIDPEIAAEAADRLENRRRQLQEQNGCRTRLAVHALSHHHMKEVLSDLQGSVDAVIFNFGWYPKEAGRSQTLPETSACAVKQVLDLLRPKGRMALVFYPHDLAEEEEEAVLSVLEARRDSLEVQKVKNLFVKSSPWVCLIQQKSVKQV